MNETRCAELSADRFYRYTLQVQWSDGPLVQFIGLNPSTADEKVDDPTMRRVKRFASDWGFAGLVMTNLFAYRSTDPEVLRHVANPIGEQGHFFTVCGTEFQNRNDFWLWTTKLRCAETVACWGTHGEFLYRPARVRLMIAGMKCLEKTKDGHPKHPLYVKANTALIPYN